MNAATVTFLSIGGIGIALLAASLILSDVPGLGDPDADGPFSLPAIAGFIGALGFGGAIAASITPDGPPSVIAGLLVGLVLAVPAAFGTVSLARAASRMRTDATPTRADVIGRIGTVVTPIPAQGYGEVRITMGGQPVKLNARSDQPVALGAKVFVVEAPSDTSVVVEETSPL